MVTSLVPHRNAFDITDVQHALLRVGSPVSAETAATRRRITAFRDIPRVRGSHEPRTQNHEPRTTNLEPRPRTKNHEPRTENRCCALRRPVSRRGGHLVANAAVIPQRFASHDPELF